MNWACFWCVFLNVASLFVLWLFFAYFSWFMSLVVSTRAVYYLERLVYERTCYVSSETLIPTHSLTHL